MTESSSEERFKIALSSRLKDLGAEVTLTSYYLFFKNLPYLLMIFFWLKAYFTNSPLIVC